MEISQVTFLKNDSNSNDTDTFCQLNVRIPKILKEYLRALSQRSECSMEVYVQSILLEHLKEQIEKE